ncbi:hypothetical protein BJX62DRAFT_244542 [Aspergillus germanicus]
MATVSIIPTPVPLNTNTTKQALRYEDSQSQSAPQSPITLLGPHSNAAITDLGIHAPFPLIRDLFDHLYTHPADMASLNATYPCRGILKTAATTKTESRVYLVLRFWGSSIVLLSGLFRRFWSRSARLRVLDVNDFADTHKSLNMNFRLCDYNPDTVAPQSQNGCGAHTDYGTFAIIFQDRTAGLELQDPAAAGGWRPVPGKTTVILTG